MIPALSKVRSLISRVSSLSSRSFPSMSVSSRFLSTAAPSNSEIPTYLLPEGGNYDRAVQGNFPQVEPLGPFGSLEAPTVVHSVNSERVVGCTGGNGVPHHILWFNLKVGPKHVCQECGQVFLLVNQSNFEQHKSLLDPVQYEAHKFRTYERQRADGAVLTVLGEHTDVASTNAACQK